VAGILTAGSDILYREVLVQIAVREVVIQPRHMSGAIELDRTDHHGLGPSIPSWPDTAPDAPFVTHSGDSSAGNGGNGYFAGSALDHSSAVFEPINVAQAAAHAWVDAYQTNTTYFGQAAIQIAGVGGDGGDENAALDGSAGSLRPLGSAAIATGASSAGNGGEGHFFGALVDAPVVIYDPVNVAVAGSHNTALSDQSNTVEFLQDATQIGGVGGNGGNSNAATSGSLFGFGVDHAAHTASIGSDVIVTGANAGNGGDGHFSGALVDAPVVIYDPINIAVAGPHGTAVTDQSNTVQSFQDTTQIAGVGGNGGNANTATSGDVFGLGAGPGTNPASTGSDVGTTGGASAGNGGDGHFSGALIATPIVIYDPINIAVAGPYGTAVADQSNAVEFQQDATQIAGVGGNGGSGNTATSGEVFGSGGGQTDAGTTGGASAGNGADGYFSGALVDAPIVIYDPINIAVAGPHGTAVADQSNTIVVLQDATQIAGVGGNGGSSNTATSGEVFGSGGGQTDASTTGGANAGNGGDGQFFGALIDAPVVIYDPINIAVAGSHGTAVADQSNTVEFLQDAIQIAGVGGNGGSGNTATSGEVFGSASSGAGDGGNGSFLGSLFHASFALYEPINIAVAGVNSSAHAEQTNTVSVDQAATQIAGVGGHGGSGNAALAGSVGALFSESGLIGSDVIAIGGSNAGDGGNGYFHGSLIDVGVAIYAPINIAIAGYNSTADAVQSNHALFDQSAIQIAGLGGDGGHADLALALHAVAEHHLLDHAL
jgi:hypothetical protein